MKNHRKGVSLKFGNNLYEKYFLQYFEGLSRVSFFHLNNWNNEGDSVSFDVLVTNANWI